MTINDFNSWVTGYIEGAGKMASSEYIIKRYEKVKAPKFLKDNHMKYILMPLLLSLNLSLGITS